VTQLAIACQSSVFRRHLNEALVELGKQRPAPEGQPGYFTGLGGADWQAKAEEWQRKTSAH
jgi:hypothetical protein